MKIGRWAMNILLSIDQLGNSLLGGDPDETISSRLGRIKLKWGGKIPWSRPVARLTELVLNRIDKDHCVEAIEQDEGDKGIIDRPSSD
jgi:hypothetical protein